MTWRRMGVGIQAESARSRLALGRWARYKWPGIRIKVEVLQPSTDQVPMTLYYGVSYSDQPPFTVYYGQAYNDQIQGT